MNIINSEKVVNVFSRWPSFHDANFADCRYDQTLKQITATLHTFRTTNEVDEKGYFVLEDHHLVTIKFDEIEELQLLLTEFPITLFSLELHPYNNGSKMKVIFDSVACDWLQLSFHCTRIEVVNFRACDAKSNPI